MSRPVDIVHARSRNTLEVTWDDDLVSSLPIPYLRGWCPCAGCQGHGNTIRYREPPAGLEISSIHEMGAYALAIRFSDGHDTGIFTWTWLRQLSPESPPVGLKTGLFDGERFELVAGPSGGRP